ncbi:MAG: sulfotransferase [Pseudomonadota bacterium]
MSTKPESPVAPPGGGKRSASAADYAQQLAMQGKFAESLHVLDDAGQSAHTIEGLYVRAVCYRKLGQTQSALAALKALNDLPGDYARAYQELGHTHMDVGATAKALVGYEHAVRLNPALVASWRALTKLYLDGGQPAALAHAQDQLRQLEQLPPELQSVKSLLHEGNLEQADRLCRHFLTRNKTHVEGMRLLAEIAIRHRIIDDAEFLLESAVAFEPKHVGARVDYVNILLKRQRFENARDIAEELVNEFPDNHQFLALLGASELGVGNTNRAIDVLSGLVDAKFNLRSSLLALGHARKTAGDFDQAVSDYQSLYHHIPDFGDAFWSLANTKTYRFADDEIQHMQTYEANESTSIVDRVHFCFALGKAFEDRADYDRAFDYYERGNQLQKQSLDYALPAFDKRVQRQIEVCDHTLFERRKTVGCPDPDPIFILGLPRAGSTLLEQILASHSRVDGTLELPNILSLSRRLLGRAPAKPGEEPQYPRILGELDDSYFERFGRQYLDNTQVFRQGAEFFIDKMPNNFLHIGLIKLILPNAKIIDARRHPMSCCFSGFKQLFAEGQEFTYGLSDIGAYYREYVRMMDHWDNVLPDFVLRVQHEDVIDDLEGQVRRLLDFCDLPFEQSCVDFHKTERNVRTPSSEQVRQPIFRTSMEQWRHFEDQLQPLIDALGPEIMERYPI